MLVRSFPIAGALVAAALLVSGCSGGGSQAPAAGFTGSGDCKAEKAEISRLASQGVANDIAAADSGRTLSPEAQARVDRYNDLLNSYLGRGCHSS